MSSSSSDSDDDVDMDKFREAVDPHFAIGLASSNGNAEKSDSTSKTKRINDRHRSDEKMVEGEQNEKRDFQAFVADRLSRLLDDRIRYIDGDRLNESSTNGANDAQDGVRLYRDSKDTVQVDCAQPTADKHYRGSAEERILNKKWKERRNEGGKRRKRGKDSCSTSSDDEGQNDRVREAAVSAEWILKQSL